MEKKKKILLAAIIACFVLAAAAAIGALVLKTAHRQADSKAQIVSFVKKHQKEYDAISSYGIQSETDELIKKACFMKLKQADENATLDSFDLMKRYDYFRVFDIKTGDIRGLVLIYADKDHAYIYDGYEYADFNERADILTDIIRRLDSDYAAMAQKAKSVGSEQIVY